MKRKTLFVVMTALVAVLATFSYHRVQAARLQASLTEICALNPGLQTAINDTFSRWPPVAPYTGSEVYGNLLYFRGTVIDDKRWCDVYADASNADLVLQTMLWHYGNASQFMRQYQAMVQAGAAPAPTATVAPRSSPTPTPTTTPTPTPTSTPTPTLRSAIVFFASDSSFVTFNDWVCPNEGRRTSIVKQGDVGVHLEWAGDGVVELRWLKEGIRIATPLENDSYQLGPPGGCTRVSLALAPVFSAYLIPPGHYQVQLWHKGAILQTANLLVVP